MRLRHIALQDFRNVPLCALETSAERVFLLGPNGQGKTNLLEAAGLASALRSFRTQEWPAMVRRGASEARVLLRIEHETDGAVELEVRLGARARTALLNGAEVARLGDLLGRFPVVALSSDDMRLLRGAPGERRRAFDLLFSSASPDYFTALRRYHGALKSRNELLRAPYADDAQLSAFEAEMALCAETLARLRAEGCAALSADVRAAYAHIGGGAEHPDVAYAPAHAPVRAADWSALFARNRAREKMAQKTLEGPHRDDYRFLFEGCPAREFASEGQQRALVVSFRLAQAHWLQRARGIRPVLIADDILGELDPARRSGFWRAVSPQWQVLASGTTPPAEADALGDWQIWRVNEGVFSLSQPAG